MRKKILIVVLLSTLVAALTACGGQQQVPQQATTGADQSQMPAKEKERFDVVASEYKLDNITLSNIEYVRLTAGTLPYVDGETVVVLGDFTNTGDDLQQPNNLYMYVHGKQDTGNTIETLVPGAISSDHPEYGDRSAVMIQEVKPGATVPVLLAFSVTQPGQPVTVEYKNSRFEVIAGITVE